MPLKDGRITDDTRVRETLPTLKCLLDGGASVVLASHLGRPEGKGFEAAYSAAPVAAWLSSQGFDCRLASYVNGAAVSAEAAALQPGQVLLLENLRFEKGETKNGADFAASLALVEEMELSFLHVFPYSERPGTPAARMPAVPHPVRKDRAARLRQAGQDAAARFYASRLGQEEDVLFERGNRGHTAHFAPIHLAVGDAPQGALRRLRVTGAGPDGLLAEVT